jgi:hypothetical protein
VGGIGADFLAEVNGFGGQPMSTRLYFFDFDASRGRNDWNSWVGINSVQTAVGKNSEDTDKLEMKVPWDHMLAEESVVDVRFYTTSFDGDTDTSDYVISNSPGVLELAQQFSLQPGSDIISITQDTRVLLFSARALAEDITVQSIRVRLIGTAGKDDIATVELKSSNGDTVSTAQVSATEAVFDSVNVEIQKDQEVQMSIDVQAVSASGRTLGLEMLSSSDVVTDNGAATIATTAAEQKVGYIATAPSGVMIDGAFADWSGMESDGLDEPSTGGNKDIDIARYANHTDGSDLSFFLEVDGDMAEGHPIPVRNHAIPEYTPGPPDSDRDTVPDSVDTWPYDFNNDGTLDVDEDGDIDGDGEPDYPGGSDEILETTIPASYPLPYRGTTVRLFIGEILKPVLEGADIARAYIDSDDDDTTGYSISKIGADHVLEIMGIEGEIVSKSVKKFTGATQAQWLWDTVLSGTEVAAELAFSNMESGFDTQGLGFGPQIIIAFETSDWMNRADEASSSGGRALTRGDYGEYDISYSSDSYDAFFTEEAGSVMFSRGGAEISWGLPDSIYWTSDGERGLIEELTLSNAQLWGPDVTYESMDSSVRVKYVVESGMLKETMTISSRMNGPEGSELSIPMNIQFSSDLMMYVEGQERDGRSRTGGPITFYERESARFHINSPYAVDSKGNRVDCEYVHLDREGSLDMVCPMNWMMRAHYPVVIDPTVSTYTLENDGTLGQAGEKFGHSVAIGDFDNDGYADVLTGAPYATVNSVSNAGAAYIYYGPFSASDTSPDVYIEGSAGTNLGWAVASGLFNNDDYWDAAVSQKDDDVYVYYGSSSWSGQENTPDVTFDESQIVADSGIEGFGMSLATGNFDYDGTPLNFDDLLIGAPFLNWGGGQPGGNPDGAVYAFISVFASTETGEDHILKPTDNKDDGRFGHAIALGKIDSDDKYDVVISEPWNVSGAVHIFYGDEINVASETPDEWLEYEVAGELYGFSVAVGDMDSDSYADILVGAPLNDEGGTDIGRAYVYQSATNGSGMPAQSAPDIDLPGQEAGSQFGFNVSVGDFYGDGVGDAVVGAPYNGTNDEGAVIIFDDPIGGDAVVDDFIDGTQTNEHFGWDVTVGEFVNDTALLLAGSAPDWDDGSPSETDAGRIMVALIPEFDNIAISVFIPLIVWTTVWHRRKRKS